MAAAAYRSGSRLVDRRTGLVHDYTRRRAQIEGWIATPEGSPEWAKDRSELWNQVEEKERRKDSQLCREFNIALPTELDEGQQRELVEGYVREQFVAEGMVADVNIHCDKEANPHAHVMLTMREITSEGFGAKQREWNDRSLAGRWREAWADHTNERLREAGIPERIDHRSNEARGIDQEPTIHEGAAARELEAKGIRTAKVDLNRDRNGWRDHRRERLQREADRRGITPEELETSLSQQRQEQRRQEPSNAKRRDRDREPAQTKDPVQLRREERLRREREEERERDDDRDL